jgi:hypothetical protein
LVGGSLCSIAYTDVETWNFVLKSCSAYLSNSTLLIHETVSV